MLWQVPQATVVPLQLVQSVWEPQCVCVAYPAGAALVTDMKSSAVTGIQSDPPVSASITSSVTKRVTEKKKSFACPYCQNTFPESVILQHEHLYCGMPFYCCLLCDKDFHTVLGL